MRAANRHTARAGGRAAVAVSRSTTEDELVLRSPVSELRKQAFFDDFLEQRRRCQTIEMLFERVGAFNVKERPAPNDLESSGFKGIILKGPFVEGSNWLSDSTWSFATAMERRLLQRLDQSLRVSTDDRLGDDVKRDIGDVLSAFEEMADELRGSGRQSTLFIVAGELGDGLYLDLMKRIIGDWDSRVQAALRTTYRIMGMARIASMDSDIPVLTLAESHLSALYAIDLARFATLTRYGKMPEFKIEDFTEDRAREILTRQPRLITDPPPESGLEEDRIRQLRLRVGLDLWETYELTVKDPSAVVGRPLMGPILD